MRLTGTNLAETLTGTPEADEIFGLGGDDRLVGGDGDDLLDGGAGTDTFVGGRGADRLVGGADHSNAIDYAAEGGPSGVHVDLVAGWARDTFGFIDIVSGVVSVTGTPYADVLIGAPEFGNDWVGHAGADVFHGRNATWVQLHYQWETGGGAIVFDWPSGTAIDTFGDIDRHSGITMVRGTSLNDRFLGDDARNMARGLAGDDHIDLGGGTSDEVWYDVDDRLGGTRPIFVDLSAGYGLDGFGGNDTLIGIEGILGSRHADTILGGSAGERLRGNAGDDRLDGRAGDDEIHGGAGDDTIQGGAGLDVAVFIGVRAEYRVVTEAGSLLVSDIHDLARDGVDRLEGVERLHFSNGVLAFDLAGNAGQAYRLYQAAFARDPDLDGLSFWTGLLDANSFSLAEIAAAFVDSLEFAAAYGREVSDAAFVDLLYRNVLQRGADALGEAFWTGRLAEGASRAEVLVHFSESTENVGLVAAAIATGIWLDL